MNTHAPDPDPKKNSLQSSDPEVWGAVANEVRRQQDGLEMIASENYTSPAVMEAAGSVLTNKYAEGYPGRRYYGGCEHVDVVENLARERAKQLFGAEFSNAYVKQLDRLKTARKDSSKSSIAKKT